MLVIFSFRFHSKKAKANKARVNGHFQVCGGHDKDSCWLQSVLRTLHDKTRL